MMDREAQPNVRAEGEDTRDATTSHVRAEGEDTRDATSSRSRDDR
ncbi:MAG: hypothetical protein ACI8RD_014017 [Bacillariaceae sp.]|jgi:hypothetical protein